MGRPNATLSSSKPRNSRAEKSVPNAAPKSAPRPRRSSVAKAQKRGTNAVQTNHPPPRKKEAQSKTELVRAAKSLKENTPKPL